jgi:hypothetical protein
MTIARSIQKIADRFPVMKELRSHVKIADSSVLPLYPDWREKSVDRMPALTAAV